MNNAVHDTSRRRWFRFSLRSTLVAITVMCCWLGWESSIVRNRQAVLQSVRGNDAFHITTAETWKLRYPAGKTIPSLAKVRAVRRWLGDEAIQQIWFMRYRPGFTETHLDRLIKAFPEAEITESLPEPCHPGCFPRGTVVETPIGPRFIESIQPGDAVTAVLPGGVRTSVTVQSVFVTTNELWKVVTDNGVLMTTRTQPVCLVNDETIQAGKLSAGMKILRGDHSPVEVLEVSPADRTEKVFNLILGDSERFIANGFLVRSKPPPESTSTILNQ